MKCAIDCLMDESLTHLHNCICDYGLTLMLKWTIWQNHLQGNIEFRIKNERQNKHNAQHLGVWI